MSPLLTCILMWRLPMLKQLNQVFRWTPIFITQLWFSMGKCYCMASYAIMDSTHEVSSKNYTQLSLNLPFNGPVFSAVVSTSMCVCVFSGQSLISRPAGVLITLKGIGWKLPLGSQAWQWGHANQHLWNNTVSCLNTNYYQWGTGNTHPWCCTWIGVADYWLDVSQQWL